MPKRSDAATLADIVEAANRIQIDWDVLWNAIHEHLPKLKRQVEQMISDLAREQSGNRTVR